MNTDHANAIETVELGSRCIQCEYDLGGLRTDGACPECGTQISTSVPPNRWMICPPEYVNRVRKGLGLVLNGILLQIVVGIAMQLAMMYMMTTASVTEYIAATVLAQLVGIALLGMIVWGWRMTTSPDPTSGFEPNGDARRRGTMLWMWVAAAGQVLAGILAIADTVLINTQSSSDVLQLVVSAASVGVSLLTLVAFAFAFVYQMLFAETLASRVPNPKAAKRARLMRWLGIVLVVPGFVIIIGPLISLIMYWNLLHRIRLDLKRIAQTQA